MDGDRITRARARIDAAARRIEAATGRATPVDGSELARKYQSLHGEAGLALAELDRVIRSLEA